MSTTVATAGRIDYFRGDQASGITGPNLAKICTFAEHICRARGKKTQYTSISLDPRKIRDFGDTLYRIRRTEVDDDGHETIEHQMLLGVLRETIHQETKAEKARAIQALRRARTRQEGLIRWRFDISSVAPKDLVDRATAWVQKYFEKV